MLVSFKFSKHEQKNPRPNIGKFFWTVNTLSLNLLWAKKDLELPKSHKTCTRPLTSLQLG